MLWEYDVQPSAPTHMGYRNLDDGDSVKVIRDIERRKLELKEFLKLGRNIFVFTPPPVTCFGATGEKQFSGTGKNRVTTRIVNEVDLLQTLPTRINPVEAAGTSIEFRGEEPFHSFWTANIDYFYYRAYFKEIVGKPLLYIKNTDKVVGTYLHLGNGTLVFMPDFVNEDNFNTKKEWKKIQGEFIDSITTLDEELRKSTGDFELPAWSSQFFLPEERKENDTLTELEYKLNNILSAISEQKNIIAKIEEYKILFTGTGRALEIKVADIFSQLGFEVMEGLPGRDDLILKYGEKVAVVEVKGTNKSAAEKHAAQLEKWVSTYIETKGQIPKGILVVNTYKDTPLDQRTESPFPHQMIAYSESRGHCLITTLQLLGLYLNYKENPDEKEKIVETLFSTVGPYGSYMEWTGFLEHLTS